MAWLTTATGGAAEVATDQRQVAIGYDRLETLALRIADAVEETDAPRADQIRTAIGEARSLEIAKRFDKVVGLLERERYASARRDQTELATQLEELLRVVMADPNAARLEEERKRLEMLRREIRASLREQRSLRNRTERGESAELAERQEELVDRIERLREPAEETDRLSGRGKASSDSSDKEATPGEKKPREGQPSKDQSGEDQSAEESSEEKDASIAGRLESAGESMRGAQQKLADKDKSAADEQLEAQRDLEAAQREAEQRLKQLREEEQQRRLASLAERLRRMHEAQTGVVGDTNRRIEAIAKENADSPRPTEATSRAAQLAAAKLAARQSDVGALADQALRVVRADGSSRVFDDALSQTIDDIRSAEERLRQSQVDGTTLAIERLVVDALAEMIAAVDESLDDLEKEKQQPPEGAPQSPQGGDPGLVSKLAELRMIRSIQARLMRQTEVWRAAAEAGEAPRAEVSQRLAGLAIEQQELAEAAEVVAGGAP